MNGEHEGRTPITKTECLQKAMTAVYYLLLDECKREGETLLKPNLSFVWVTKDHAPFPEIMAHFVSLTTLIEKIIAEGLQEPPGVGNTFSIVDSEESVIGFGWEFTNNRDSMNPSAVRSMAAWAGQ